MKNLIVATTALMLLTLGGGRALAEKYEANWASLDQRPMPAWFNEAKFGIFVVWGPYCVPAYVDKGYAEWYGNRMHNKNSATGKFHAKHFGADFKYEQFAESFKAELWDPDLWCDLFVRAGAKYVVTTANYHDGFALYPTKYDATTVTDKWNSVEAGPKRDLLGELNAAGRKRNLKMGIYYSLYEWYHPLWLADRDRYVVEKFHPQFKEVVTQYQPPVIFLDGEWEMDFKKWRSEELCAWLFNESPVKDVVAVNDRWGKCRGQHGSFYESEYGGGNMSPAHPWQEDRGIGHSYGYNRMEGVDDYDTGPELIRMLSKVMGNGGNYLLCVGPTADGRIPVIMQQRLLEIGAWLKVNGEAIYSSTASPFWPRKFEWGACTYKPGKIYVHVYGRPKGVVELPGLKNKVTAVYPLADRERPLVWEQGKYGVALSQLEGLYPDDTAIFVVEIEGEPEIDSSIRQGADGRVALRAVEAAIHGASPRYEKGGGKDNIGYWANPADSVSWTFQVETPGEFEVAVTYSCAKDFGGSEFELLLGKQKLSGKTKETGAWNVFKPEKLGRLKLERAGKYTLTVQPRATPPWKSMGLQLIALEPVKP